MSSDRWQRYLSIFFTELIAAQILLSAVQERSAGVAPRQWVPHATFAVSIGLLLPVAWAGTWLGVDPGDVERFTLTHWLLLGGVFAMVATGVAFLSIGYDSLSAWALVVVGSGGVVVLALEWFQRDGGWPAEVA